MMNMGDAITGKRKFLNTAGTDMTVTPGLIKSLQQAVP